jgi:hypothetical protein
MPLHIFLSGEELLYFFVRVEVIEIQILFKFKLVCSLQKGLKFYKGISIFLRHIGLNPTLGPAGLLSCAVRERPSAWLSSLASLASAHPSSAARSNPLSVNPSR